MENNVSSKEELMQYLHLLQGLKNDGIKCEQEISQTLKELNRRFFPQAQSTAKVNVVVLTTTPDDFRKYTEVFTNLFGGNLEMMGRTSTYEAVLKNANATVRIYNVGIGTDRDKLRGLSADLIINLGGIHHTVFGIRQK